jgi:hypothetical protein
VAKLTIRSDLVGRGSIGPGKSRLLELVGESGSISAAGSAMKMTYRRAWLLIDGLNRYFRTPVIKTQAGDIRGGGAVLTDLGPVTPTPLGSNGFACLAIPGDLHGGRFVSNLSSQAVAAVPAPATLLLLRARWPGWRWPAGIVEAHGSRARAPAWCRR